LAIFWWVQGYAAEARWWADELLSHEASLSALSRSQVHLISGLATAWEGDYGRARPLLERAVAEFRELGDSLGAGVAQMALAYVLPIGGDYQHTEALLLESAADLYQAGDLWAVNVALQSRADVALAAADVKRARDLYQDSLQLATTQSDARGKAQALIGLGFVDLIDGDLSAATEQLRQSVAMSRELANPELLAYALRGLAGVAQATHQPSHAAQLLGLAQALADASGTVDWPVRRMLYTHVEQEVRKVLGAARFAEAYAAGRARTLSEAADFALNQTTCTCASLAACRSSASLTRPRRRAGDAEMRRPNSAASRSRSSSTTRAASRCGSRETPWGRSANVGPAV
jgi:hypothetical protein